MRKFLKTLSIFILFVTCFSLTNFVEAYDQSLTTPQYPENYYNAVDTSLSSDAFKQKLSTIISNGFKSHSYGSIGAICEKADPDPKKAGNIICFYTGQSLSGGWNKEHVWAKSHGFPNTSSDAYSDAHHLRPTLISINSNRSNYDFDEVENHNSSYKSDNFGNKWIVNTCFEPRDEVKGDVARIMFYMETKYLGGSEKLQITENIPSPRTTGNGRLGRLSTLIKWHYEDPVSDEEVYRNNVIYGYQNNRNPYIDHPEYVDYAYPSEYSSDIEVNQENVDAVINQINAITTVSLENKNVIIAAHNAYKALNYAEKKLVTNYNKLQEYLLELDRLDGNDNPGPDIDAKGDIIVDFTKAQGTGGYVSNRTYTFDEKNYLASSSYVASKEFRLGSNKVASLDSKFNPTNQTNQDGSYLEMKYDVIDAKTVTFSSLNKYGTISKWYIMYSLNKGLSYQVGSSGDKYDSTMSFQFDSPTTARFALVIIGNTPRVVLNTLKIDIEEKSSINQESIDDIIAKINNLGAAYFSIEYLEKLNVIEDAYALLSKDEKALVTNYDKYLEMAADYEYFASIEEYEVVTIKIYYVLQDEEDYFEEIVITTVIYNQVNIIDETVNQVLTELGYSFIESRLELNDQILTSNFFIPTENNINLYVIYDNR